MASALINIIAKAIMCTGNGSDFQVTMANALINVVILIKAIMCIGNGGVFQVTAAAGTAMMVNALIISTIMCTGKSCRRLPCIVLRTISVVNATMRSRTTSTWSFIGTNMPGWSSLSFSFDR